MKVLIGGFVAESNARVKEYCELTRFMLKTGDEVAKALYVDDLFAAEGIEVIPAIYADGRAGGIVAKEAFDYIANQFIKAVKEHQHELDGMFFFLHGASHVQELSGGSGEHYIIREIRKIVGPYMPIAMVMDPHGNLSQEQADNCTIIRTFRHSPHTDRRECHRFVASLLIDLLNHRRNIHPVYRKVPVLWVASGQFPLMNRWFRLIRCLMKLKRMSELCAVHIISVMYVMTVINAAPV